MTAADEQEVNVERGAANVQRILHGERGAENGGGAQETASARTRATRSDKGQPRLHIEIPGVRFDLMNEEGHRAFELSIWHAGKDAVESAIHQLLAHIDRLVKNGRE